ncbi:MAG: hypothetical protein ABJE95_05450 [Byssovorax sp.]
MDQILTTFTVFEPGQVLTEAQLNAAVDYLDDQERLTRVELLGVGIFCGLRASRSGDQITLTRGVGVTTDGDLLSAASDTVYESLKPYGAGAPEYAPFMNGELRIDAWELLPVGTTDALAVPFAQLGATTNRSWDDLAVVFLMESYLEHQDLCTGTTCDNLGLLSLHESKLILIPRSAVGPFKESLTTPAAAAKLLDYLVADRPSIVGITTSGGLNSAYRAACQAILGRLTTALPRLYPACQGFLGDVFTSDPSAQWLQTLRSVVARFESGKGIQYCYDFLKDLVETSNAFRDELAGLDAVCSPDLTAFPKHLLLGDVTGRATSDQDRTGRYPSPVVGDAGGRLDHARFLARKLGVLIDTFALPTGTTPIRITPSHGEDRSLEERAIPFYYDPDNAEAIHESWSHALQRRGMSAFNYSYNANRYAAQGGAASPFTAQIGRFSCFRIEGHLGSEVSAAVSAIQEEIKSKNLPFAVHAVLLEKDKTKIIRWRPPIYTDLHRVHRLLRYALSDQLDNAADYADSLNTQVVNAKIDGDQIGEDPAQLAGKKRIDVKHSASNAASKLRRSFDANRVDASWRDDVGETQKSAAELKQRLGPVAKTEFTTPFDTLIGSLGIQLLGPLDDIIKGRQDKADDHHVFATFVDKHPGLEHFAGVARGGTFVLAYDTFGFVVADFMLPYLCCEPDEPEAELPPSKPGLKIWPDWVIQKGITFSPALGAVIKGGIDKFWTETQPKIKEQIAAPKELFQMIKDIFPARELPAAITAAPRVKDGLLALALRELDIGNERVDLLRSRLLDPGRSAAERAHLRSELAAAEGDLSVSATKATAQVKSGNLDVTHGSDGFTAMQAVSDSARRLQDATAIKRLHQGLTQLHAGASKDLGGIVSTLLGKG